MSRSARSTIIIIITTHNLFSEIISYYICYYLAFVE